MSTSSEFRLGYEEYQARHREVYGKDALPEDHRGYRYLRRMAEERADKAAMTEADARKDLAKALANLENVLAENARMRYLSGAVSTYTPPTPEDIHP